MKIYHNPRCTKSRQTLALLEEKGVEPEIIEYLKDIPSQAELGRLLKALGIKAEDLIRKNEPVYKEKFKGQQLSQAEWIKAMVTYPKLIERPIVVKGNKAVIGRPPENVLELL
ncbi:MAG: arsenate reductase (glutaredoxin) [Saprospiraceae bacterium]|nr:arsenate reductase (glutaredoxin) [Saprospiraceae bacterium]